MQYIGHASRHLQTLGGYWCPDSILPFGHVDADVEEILRGNLRGLGLAPK